MWQVRLFSSFISLKQTKKKTAYKWNKNLSTVGRGTPEMLIINSKRDGDKICATVKKKMRGNLYKVIKPHVWYCGIKYWDLTQLSSGSRDNVWSLAETMWEYRFVDLQILFSSF